MFIVRYLFFIALGLVVISCSAETGAAPPSAESTNSEPNLCVYEVETKKLIQNINLPALRMGYERGFCGWRESSFIYVLSTLDNCKNTESLSMSVSSVDFDASDAKLLRSLPFDSVEVLDYCRGTFVAEKTSTNLALTKEAYGTNLKEMVITGSVADEFALDYETTRLFGGLGLPVRAVLFGSDSLTVYWDSSFITDEQLSCSTILETYKTGGALGEESSCQS